MYNRDNNEDIKNICGSNERKPVETQNILEEEEHNTGQPDYSDNPKAENLGEARPFKGPLQTADVREEPILNVAPEHSVQEENKDMPNIVTLVAQKLIDHLQHSFQGYTAEQHN